MSRCRICDTKLTNKELAAKDHRTFDYLNTCNTCKNVTNDNYRSYEVEPAELDNLILINVEDKIKLDSEDF